MKHLNLDARINTIITEIKYLKRYISAKDNILNEFLDAETSIENIRKSISGLNAINTMIENLIVARSLDQQKEDLKKALIDQIPQAPAWLEEAIKKADPNRPIASWDDFRSVFKEWRSKQD